MTGATSHLDADLIVLETRPPKGIVFTLRGRRAQALITLRFEQIGRMPRPTLPQGSESRPNAPAFISMPPDRVPHPEAKWSRPADSMVPHVRMRSSVAGA